MTEESRGQETSSSDPASYEAPPIPIDDESDGPPDVDPRTWPDERHDGAAVARTTGDGDMVALQARVAELEVELEEAEDAVMQQEDEIMDLEERLKDADAALNKKGFRRRLKKVMQKERTRLKKEHDQAFKGQAMEHSAQLAEVETYLEGERARLASDIEAAVAEEQVAHQAELQGKDQESADLQRDLDKSGRRIEDLENEVLRLEGALHRADIRQKALIDQAAKDVVEAARTGKMPSGKHRSKARTPRDMQRVKAEDGLWDSNL